ncbi:hypothetical protein CS063_03205 [Sporanaerobium hydrogeniformans]|uniref:Uncharacterized protein n=1 Tax=Sporanaerobium hydrogeniformans TaxID=3072179 RepID=A0AC61DFF0_9FIRM|nr:hypothetical protein [Sporanaerobium hydrogeniformans]PHV71585.1 hypothetical protein CS063_03205 [Sporanaerobium hydrogeniformans]
MSNCLSCGGNATLVAVLLTVLFSRCLNNEQQDTWGNMLLLIGQVLIVIAAIDEKEECPNNCYNHFGRDFGGFEGANY